MTTSRLIEEAKKLGYEVIKPRENERYEIVSAESKAEVEDKLKEDKERIDISNICRYSYWF